MRVRLLFLALGLFGCMPQPALAPECPTEIPVARFSESRSPQKVRYIARSLEDAAAIVSEKFSEEKILSYFWREASYAQIRSEALPEPDLEKIHRRSFIYIHIQGGYPSPNCSNVEVRWYTERRKFDEINWEPSKEETGFEPLMWPKLAPVFASANCAETEPPF